MKFIDITRKIHPQMAIYPGNPDVLFAEDKSGSSVLTHITLGSHTGTHIDAPSHIKAGAAGTGSYPLEQMIGPCEVIMQKSGGMITADDLPPTARERILIKTPNSSGNPDEFDPDFVALDESAAEELVRRGVRLVGIDGPSIKKKGVRDRTHEILLDARVVILEGLWLKDAQPDRYELICLPMGVDLDGAPARVVLRQGFQG